MRDHNVILKLLAPALVVALLITACSKSEEHAPAPPQPAPAATDSTQPAPAAAAVPSSKPVEAVAPTAQPTPLTPVTTPSGGAAQVAASLEAAYIANPEFGARVETIYKLTDASTPEAIASLGRLFHMEKDPELKTEILDSLFDIDGQDERKAALLAAGAGADQPKEVRLSAIDGLEDVDAKYALPILQAMASDPDEEIREAAKDAIEMLQPAVPAQPAQAK